MVVISGVRNITIARPWNKIYRLLVWKHTENYLFFWTFDFAKLATILSFLLHRLFALIKCVQEIFLRPNHWGAIFWKCSVHVHTAYFIASTLLFLASNPQSWRWSGHRLTSARCHHWTGNGLLSLPGEKNKKEDGRIHCCHRPKRFVLYLMWIVGTPPYL